tara:strand:+ start:32 stop:316 length:285 start_codon:yes stop_codon:yes gene_type:complete
MGKKNKTVDLKPKADKISDEQLKKLQATISDMNRMHVEIGRIESQKQNLLLSLVHPQKALKDLQDEFIKDYGTFDININNGLINYNDEQTNKKD